MNRELCAACIQEGKAILGMELGSTRIKAVLIDECHTPIAIGVHEWENRLENGVWTYRIADVWTGIRHAYAELKAAVKEQYGVVLTRLAGAGISAMMHGYLPFDKDGVQLTPFRTWRNTMTARASKELTELFGFNIPQRWSIAHLDQAILNGEAHVHSIAFLTTLAGYVHWKLTGRKVLGIGDASGMFPIGDDTGNYDARMMTLYGARAAAKGCALRLADILPEVCKAGEDAGFLTNEGAKLLDPSGDLEAGCPLCPPEGDAGTGMAATNSVGARTGNISAGTSVFAMVVLDKPLSKVYPEIDMVATPTGKPVAMVHCNNCTSDINAWVDMLSGFVKATGLNVSKADIYTTLFQSAMDGEKDCGGLINYNFLSGEPVVGVEEGRPMLVRLPGTPLTFQNFSRSLVYGAIAALRIGMDILAKERVRIDSLLGHGGFFKTPGTAQKLLAAALRTPVSVMETAGDGGPWGMALLAAYRAHGAPGQTLESYLSDRVFFGATASLATCDEADAAGFDSYVELFQKGISAEKAAAGLVKGIPNLQESK